jgi:hypothetical protein
MSEALLQCIANLQRLKSFEHSGDPDHPFR